MWPAAFDTPVTEPAWTVQIGYEPRADRIADQRHHNRDFCFGVDGSLRSGRLECNDDFGSGVNQFGSKRGQPFKLAVS